MSSQSIPATSGIYRIACIPTGKIYIGSAANLHKRYREHFNVLRRNDHHSVPLQRAWNKHGEAAFTFEVIELVLPAFLLEREQYYFDLFKPFGKNGFNVAPTAGSRMGTTHSLETRTKIGIKSIGRTHNLGRKHSPEAREKMRIKALGRRPSKETRALMENSHTGKKHNVETREKMRTAQLGKKMSPASRANFCTTKTKLVLIITAPDGTEYPVHGVKQFCEDHNLHYSHIIEVAQGKSKHHKGWTSRYPDD